MSQLSSPVRKPRGFVTFALVLLGLVVVDVLLGVAQFPIEWDRFLSPIITAIYVTAPIWALFEASREKWNWKLAVRFIVFGVLIHLLVLVKLHPPTTQFQFICARALAGLIQSGLLTWCLGLGALLATLLKDKNLLLPVAIFLAAFDIFVILTPGGPTQQIMAAHPEMFSKIAYTIPRAGFIGAEASSAIAARIGPADMFLLAMFFIALNRFEMRAAATFRAMAGALVVYLLVVIVFGKYRLGPIRLDALPALVPIGAVILIVNRKEFSLTREEQLSTAVVAVIGVGLIGYGATRRRSGESPNEQSGLLQPAPGRERLKRAGSRGSGVPSQPPSGSLSAPADTPSPR